MRSPDGNRYIRILFNCHGWGVFIVVIAALGVVKYVHRCMLNIIGRTIVNLFTWDDPFLATP